MRVEQQPFWMVDDKDVDTIRNLRYTKVTKEAIAEAVEDAIFASCPDQVDLSKIVSKYIKLAFQLSWKGENDHDNDHLMYPIRPGFDGVNVMVKPSSDMEDLGLDNVMKLPLSVALEYAFVDGMDGIWDVPKFTERRIRKAEIELEKCLAMLRAKRKELKGETP